MSDPFNPEVALLGCILAGARDVDETLAIVKATDFDEPRWETIWRAIVRIASVGELPEAARVAQEMGSELTRMPGGAGILANLVHNAPVSARATYYAEVVRDQAIRRRILAAARDIATKAELIDEVPQLVETARAAMEAATTQHAASDIRLVSDYLEDVYDIAQNGHQDGLDTPWPSVDRIIRGLQPGRLIVIGARPGIGKSIMGINLAHHVAKTHERAVVFASLEMPGVEVTQRLIAHHSSVPLQRLDSGNLSDALWDKLNTAHSQLQALPLYVDDSADQSLASIRSFISGVRRRRDDLGLIVVDYLQLMTARCSSP